MWVIFCNCHHDSNLTIAHSIFCYIVVCLFFDPLRQICQLYNCPSTSGVAHFTRAIILHMRFYYQHMGLIFITWSLMVFDEHKVNSRFPCTKSQQWRENVDGHFKTIAVSHSFMTCHWEAYKKTNYPSGHVFLRSWQIRIQVINMNSFWWSPCWG